MVRRLWLTVPVGIDELERPYHQAGDPLARPPDSSATGYSATGTYRIFRRYNAAGAAGVGDQRRQYLGAAPLLDTAQRATLRAALAGLAPDDGV